MSWTIQYLPEAEEDLRRLDGSERKEVLKAIRKVSTNPLPQTNGGFGKSLGNQSGSNLSGYLKIELKASGLRVVYRLVKVDDVMIIIVIGARADSEVYKIAAKRIDKHGLK